MGSHHAMKAAEAARLAGPRLHQQELERRSFGHCQRMEHQVLWELRYSGMIEELAALPPRQRERRFDQMWEALTDLIRTKALAEAEERRGLEGA